MEKVVETKICKHCSSKFEITDKDLEFYEKVSPIFSICHSKTMFSAWLGIDCRIFRK